MKRREFIALVGGIIVGLPVWPTIGRAQQSAKPVVGVLDIGTPESKLDPSSTRVAEEFAAATAVAASHFAVTAVEARVHEPADIDKAMRRLGEQPGGSLITPPDTFLGLHFREVVEQERRWRLPAIHPFRYFVEAGSLMSYGPDVEDQFRQAALYINRILHGENQTNLPVQQPTKFEFVINLKAAKVLGLNVSSSVLATADQVIE